MKILDIPAQTATLERIFSHENRIHSKERIRLKNDVLEKLLSVQNYLNINYVDENPNESYEEEQHKKENSVDNDSDT